VSASQPDNLLGEISRRLVRAALAGDAGARVVLADRLRVVPAEVARRAGAEGPESLERATKMALGQIARALPTYRGDEELEDWALKLTRDAVDDSGPAQDPGKFAENFDLERALDGLLPAVHPGRRSLLERLKRARRSVRVALVAIVLAMFFVADPLMDRGDSKDVDKGLGGSVQLIFPVGASDSFETFRWSGPEDGDYTARVVVHANDGRTVSSPPLSRSEWTPRPGLLRDMGGRIRWEVTARYEGLTERGWAYAWRTIE